MRHATVGVMMTMIISLTVIANVAAPSRAAESAAVVTRLDGTATVYAAGAKTGTALQKNDRLMRGQEVLVGESSRLEVKYPDGTVMRFAERTRIRLEDISYDSGTRSKKMIVVLAGGKIWANVRKLMTSDSRVEVRTVNAVAGVRGTVYRVTVEGDNSAVIKVYEGPVYVSGLPHEVPKPAEQVPGPVPVPGTQEVPAPYHEVTMEKWTVIVQSMQQISVSPQGVASPPQDLDPQQDADDWVRWNQERDKEIRF